MQIFCSPFMPLAGILLASVVLPTAWADGTQYLLISQPKLQKIVYMKFTTSQKADTSFRQASQDLIVDNLNNPMGLAVFSKTNELFVADPGQMRILKYQIVFDHANGKLVAAGMDTAAQDVEAKWVAVDGIGNLYFTDDKNNLIQMIDSESVRTGFPQRVVTLYDASGAKNSVGVSAPAGIATDNFHVFWANKNLGTQVGSVIQGMANHEPQLRRLADNTLKSFGVCLTATNIFFTDESFNVYGMKQSGTQPITVTDKLKAPRGCAWDGDGTIFVADSTGDGIYSFPGNMMDITPTRIRKLGSVPDPWGLAILSSVSTRVMFSSLSSICISLHLFL